MNVTYVYIYRQRIKNLIYVQVYPNYLVQPGHSHARPKVKSSPSFELSLGTAMQSKTNRYSQ